MVLVASVSEVEGGGRNMADLCLARVLKHATPQPAFVDTSWRADTLYRGVARIFGGGGGAEGGAEICQRSEQSKQARG